MEAFCIIRDFITLFLNLVYFNTFLSFFFLSFHAGQLSLLGHSDFSRYLGKA